MSEVNDTWHLANLSVLRLFWLVAIALSLFWRYTTTTVTNLNIIADLISWLKNLMENPYANPLSVVLHNKTSEISSDAT